MYEMTRVKILSVLFLWYYWFYNLQWSFDTFLIIVATFKCTNVEKRTRMIPTPNEVIWFNLQWISDFGKKCQNHATILLYITRKPCPNNIPII